MSSWRCLLVAVVVAASGPGQWQYGNSGPQWPQGQQGQQGQNQGQGGAAQPGTTAPGVSRYPENVLGPQSPFLQGQPTFPGIQPTNPEFRGFPSVLDRQGFGAYPNYPGFSPSTKIGPERLPPVGPLRPPGLWPSWLTSGRTDEGARVRADRALLVRNSERVWYRAADEPVFVPLPFYDKVREALPGAQVQIRTNSGELTLLFHDGATLRARGIIALDVRILSEAVGELAVGDVFRAWIDIKQRPLRLVLPDASTLEAAGTLVYLARHEERVTVCNYGPALATLRSPFGTVDIPRNHQVQIMALPVPQDVVATRLEVAGTVRARVDGRRLLLDGGNEGGMLEWSGARVRLDPGRNAALDALAGDSFPEYRAAGKTAAVTPQEAPPRPSVR